MNTATIEKLTDLLSHLDCLGVTVVPDGDTLRYRPRSAMTPDLAALLKKYRAELLTALRPPMAPVEAVEAVLLESSIEPPNPCPDCDGLLFWWNLDNDQRCMICDPPTTSIKALETVERIRRWHSIPSPAGVPEMISDLKRIILQDT